jgi:predicted HicB family RNase H-like nuclease
MNSKHQKNLESIVKNPIPANYGLILRVFFRHWGMMEYKGYLGTVEYDADAKLFHGDIINTRDVITFQGTTVEEIDTAFRDSIEDYLAWCKEDGVEPEKPYSGKFNVRLSPELHKEIAIRAKKLKMSINGFVEKAISDEIAIMH